MKKLFLTLALLATLGLAACGGSAAPTETSQPNESPTLVEPSPIASTPMECTLFDIFPEPRDPEALNLPPITDADWQRGAEDARLVLLEYTDFQCPYCSLAAEYLRQFEAAYPQDVRVVVRHFPIPSLHDKAILAAQAAEAAGLQGKFWEMHDFLFKQSNVEFWSGMELADFEIWIGEQAVDLGLDAEQFVRDLTSDTVVSKVEAAYTSAAQTGLGSTPSIYMFMNGELIFTPEDQVPYDFNTLETILKLLDLENKKYTACPPMVIDPAKNYTATLKTEKGDIKVKFYADVAPLAVNSFVFLAREGYFDGVSFHRVLEGFVAQAGDPSGTGAGGPGYQFKVEVDDALKFDRAGLLAMANSGGDTNGSQFFITFKELPSLDGGYTIFGEVIEGLDVALSLTLRDPTSAPASDLPEGDKILAILIEEN